MRYIFTFEKLGNGSIRKYLGIWIFFKKCLKGFKMIVISMFMGKKNCINIFELGMYLNRERSWIGQESFSFYFYKETAMSEFGNFHDANN